MPSWFGRGKNSSKTNSPRRPKTPTKQQRPRSKSNYIVDDAPLNVYVADRVKLKNKREGKVTCIGPKEGRNGLWIRLQIDAHTSIGAVDDSQGGRQKAVWISISRVDSVIEVGKKFKYTVGDRVSIQKKKLQGTVRYVGPTHFEKGVWFGIELDKAKGKNNGTVKRKFYFECRKNYGVFVNHKKLESENSKNKKPKTPKKNKKSNKSNENNENEKNNVKTKKIKKSIFPRRKNDSNSDDEELLPDEPEYFEDVSVSDLRPNSPEGVNGKKGITKQQELSKKELREKNPLKGFLKLTGDSYGFIDGSKGILSKEQPRKRKITLRGLQKELYEAKLPPLASAPKDERENIFKQKLRLSRAICDFNDLTKVKLMMIEKKERILTELSEFIAKHHWFKEHLFKECLETIRANLFRPLPYLYRPPMLSFFNDEVFDKDSNFEDPSWTHLKLVYDLTWRVINTPQVTAAMMEKYMVSDFLNNLVELFASEDHRERAYLMMILHKIYGRCLKLRTHVIDVICSYMFRMIYASEFNHVNGIVELLQIICAIIPGLTVPVKDSWQMFLRNILVPLHKSRGLKKFWEQLTQCCVNYVAKDGQGGAVILGGLLKFWPKQSPQKEEIFIMEVVNIINVLINHQEGFKYEDYKEILVASAHKLTQCMLSTRQPVAERAIAAWKEQSMQHMVDYDRKAFLPKLAEAFYKNRNHHNQALKLSSNSVEKIYKSKDSLYWKKMQQYLSKKDLKEKDAEQLLINSTQKCEFPSFPFKLKKKKDKPKTTTNDKSNSNSNSDSDNKEDTPYKKDYDSFHIYALDIHNNLDYSILIPKIQIFNEKEKNKSKKRNLTPSEITAKRKARWAGVNALAKQNDSNVITKIVNVSG